MSDAPETIWARPDPYEPDWTGDRTLRSKSHVEYRRADLPPIPEQIMTDPRVKALVDALNSLEKHSSITSKCGATVGSHWTHLTVSILKARAAIAAIKETK